MSTLSVVLPAYNEERGIAGMIERVLGVGPALATLDFRLELLVVDDGSKDGTAALAARFPEVQLIRHPSNRGYGAALKTGFRHASGDYLAFLDADGTYPPESLPDLCRAAVSDRADVIVGSRMSGAANEMPRLRRLGNTMYAELLSAIGRVRVRDTASGMRVLRRDALDRLYPLPDGLEFTPVMSTRAIYENLTMIEVPIPYDRRVGTSKLSVVRDGVQFTSAIVWTALTYNPVRILGVASLALLAAALLLTVAIAARAGFGRALEVWQVYALACAAVLAFTGVSLFSLGAMFNYLVSLFHKRPVRQGLFGRPIFVPPLDHHFGWIGAAAVVSGVALAGTAFGLSVSGWTMERLWMPLLAATVLVIVGVQLAISWIVMRVLEQLAARERSAGRDRGDAGTPEAIRG